MELLRRCEQSRRRAALLEKRLRELSTLEAPPQGPTGALNCPAPVVADQGTQADDVAREESHDERALAELNERAAAVEAAEAAKTAELSRARDEVEQLRRSLKQLREELVHETYARHGFEDVALELGSLYDRVVKEFVDYVFDSRSAMERLRDAHRHTIEAHNRDLDELRRELQQRDCELESLREHSGATP